MMIMTVLEGHVEQDKWAALEQAYLEATRELEPGIVQTSLVQSIADSTLWQLMTVWESREALMQARQPGQTRRGTLIFQAAGSEATHVVFNVIRTASRAAGSAPHAP